jgi:hypothetical protein
MKTFDPWTASWEEASQEQERHAEGEGPVFQWQACRDIESMKPEIDSGSGFAVLACIRKIVTHGLVAPAWLANAFNRRYDSVLNCRVRSWDDPKAFGVPYPKNAKLPAMKTRRGQGLSIYRRVEELVGTRIYAGNPDLKAIPDTFKRDDVLFEKVGKEFKIGKTACGEIYRAMAIRWRNVLPKK